MTENQQQYLGRQVAHWELPLKPRPEHFDRRITVATPLEKAGAYLLSAKMAGGNTSYIILWLNDTAIVRKPLPGKNYYYVADAVSGCAGREGRGRVLRLAAEMDSTESY